VSEVDHVLRILSEREPDRDLRVLATIVDTRGSTPRKEGARMVVGPGGEVLAGTVGGGCGEGEVLEAAREVLDGGPARMVRVDLTEDLITLSPAVCGGTMDVWVEPVES
jgi:xanthine/CO dehydrogenase XdhC/CoxF family maturation factor